jgi:dienelactone hydrolase
MITSAAEPQDRPAPNGDVPREPAPASAPGPRWRRVRRWLAERRARLVEAVRPGPQAWRGASLGLGLAALLVLVTVAWWIVAVPSPNWVALVPIVTLPLAGLLLGALVNLLLAVLVAMPSRYRLFLATAITVLLLAVAGLAPLGVFALLAVVVVAASALGAGIGALAGAGRAHHTRTHRAIAIAGTAVGIGTVAIAVGWLLWDGPGEQAPINAAVARSARPPAVLDAEDPSRPGAFPVQFLSYGSGTDRHRPEFGAEAALRTAPVDGSPFVERWSGAAGWARTRYWGFDARALPLQARVWYPAGDGPFPLVLIVHGNHMAEDYSDPGYEYLGTLLASRGFILASVDQNFLNGSAADLLGVPEPGLKEENDARGWLLLEHLKAWREWDRTEGHPFHGRVDLDRVALIGHSRGGEAVAVAAVFNRLRHYPDDARVRFDYGFGVSSVVAIAPVDGQYRPAATGTKPEDVNYLVLHGSHDGDVQSFHGARVYQRVRFGEEHDLFKAGLYIHGANHGQFNSGWGRSNAGSGLRSRLLNLRALMPEADQRRIAEVYISAFLEATLHGRDEYRPLFRDHRVGADWLPEAVYLHQYQDATTRFISTFEEDIDVTTTTLAGGRAEGRGLTDWKERQISIKWGSLETRAVLLGWNRDDEAVAAPAAEESAGEEGAEPGEPHAAPPAPSYTISLPEEGFAVAEGAVITFHLADAKQEPSKPLRQTPDQRANGKAREGGKASEAAENEGAAPREPIDLTIEVVDRAGTTARLPLSHVAALQPQLEASVPKARWLSKVPRSEVVFQVFEFPLADFAAAAPALDPGSLAEIRFVFDRSPKGVVVLDDVGIRR